MGTEAPLQIDPEFRALLEDYAVDDLNREASAVIGLWPDARIALLNKAWFEFAEENEGSQVLERFGLGDSLLLGIAGPLRDYYADMFGRVLREGGAWEQTYSCNSASEERQYHLLVQSLEGKGLLLTHSLTLSAAMEKDESFIPELYVDASGLVHQCSNCRRVQRADQPHPWVWVPALVAKPPPNASHGLCGPCNGQYSSAIRAYIRDNSPQL